jgi:hypothetical protein
MADFAAAATATARSGRARHRAVGAAAATTVSSTMPASSMSADSMSADSMSAMPVASQEQPTADLDAVLALAGAGGAGALPGLVATQTPGTIGTSMNGGGASAMHRLSAPDDISSLTGPGGATAGSTPDARTADTFSASIVAPEIGPDRAATMFTGPDAITDEDAAAGHRVPAGPPAGMSVEDVLPEATVQGTQTATVRISPAAAAGVIADGPPASAESVNDTGDLDDRLPGRGPGRRRAI